VSGPVPADRELAAAVREAALAVPGVARLAPGTGAEVATHFPGGKLVGVRLAGATVQLHLVVDRLPVPPIAGQVERAVRAVLAGAGDPRPVRVVVEDVDQAAFPALPTGG
jgi:hypothetical protein